MNPLDPGLKLFNQRLLAEHCLSDHDARALWKEIQGKHDMGADTFEKSMCLSNDALKYAGLEIMGVSLPEVVGTPNGKNNKGTNKRSLVRYYSIMNRFPDDIAKKCFQGMFPPEQQAYVRLVYEKLIEVGPSSRATILNYKNLLNADGVGSQRLSMSSQMNMTQNSIDPNDGTTVGTTKSLTLSMVEDILDQLLAQKWLVLKLDARSGSSQNTNRRVSNASLIEIGPRSYIELSYLLVDEFGMDKDDQPQIVYHRL